MIQTRFSRLREWVIATPFVGMEPSHFVDDIKYSCIRTTSGHRVNRTIICAIPFVAICSPCLTYPLLPLGEPRNWERELFGGAYDDAKGFDRCKYGALYLGPWVPEEDRIGMDLGCDLEPLPPST